MKTTAQIILVIVLIVIVAVVYGAVATKSPTPTPAPVACTMEAKLCPDGSSVGRSGPKCEFAACPTPPATTTPPVSTASGIHGKVMMGPTCPVEKNPPDPACADKPYQTLVFVFRASDLTRALTETHSAADGTFTFSLPPGDYTLDVSQSSLPRCDHPSVTVLAGAFVTAVIECDTGIR